MAETTSGPAPQALGGALTLEVDAGVVRGTQAPAAGSFVLTAEAEVVPGNPTDFEEDR